MQICKKENFITHGLNDLTIGSRIVNNFHRHQWADFNIFESMVRVTFKGSKLREEGKGKPLQNLTPLDDI